MISLQLRRAYAHNKEHAISSMRPHFICEDVQLLALWCLNMVSLLVIKWKMIEIIEIMVVMMKMIIIFFKLLFGTYKL